MCIACLISIHAPHTGSDAAVAVARVAQAISIHAPHTGSDALYGAVRGHSHDFNPRSPYGERRGGVGNDAKDGQFQSTLPIRGATNQNQLPRPQQLISIHAPHTGSDSSCALRLTVTHIFQSTLPIRGATHCRPCHLGQHYISIHAPHTGSDLTFREMRMGRHEFQSTLPIRGATACTGAR